MSQPRSLPPAANLRQLRNQAKDLHRACRNGDRVAIRRIGVSHPRFSGLPDAEIAAAGIALADAQLVIARELGFDSWPKLKRHVESLSPSGKSLHELVKEDNMQAIRATVAAAPESVNQLND